MYTWSNRPLVTIIVLNWNQPELTLDCLSSLQELEYSPISIIVVDNGSDDNSVVTIRERFPDVTLIETRRNLGYAGGNNIGINYALSGAAEFVCLLNNDVKVTPDFLTPLVDLCSSIPNIGVAVPLVIEMGDLQRVWSLGARVNHKTGTVTRLNAGNNVASVRNQAPFPVDSASGEAMLIRHEVFLRVGLLDEDFYLYYEDTDWSLRVRRAGFEIYAVPGSLVMHQGSASLGATSPVIDYYMLRNHLRLITRHWQQPHRFYLQLRIALRNLLTVAAYTVKPHGGRRIPNRDARLLALRDALLGRWGKMAPDVEKVCYPDR